MLNSSELSKWLGPQATAEQLNSHAVRVCQIRLKDALARLERLVSPDAVKRVAQLHNRLDSFSVRISLLGQVKAGKTALTNAMIGMPNLLPSDVNPWTSVITSVHMNTEQPMGKNAVFNFFSTDEWNKMVDVGGHLGEMAERTGYKEELEDLRAQVQQMQARTQTRLGRNFDMLLDGYHSFLGFSPELISKYVCLGEDESDNEGRYADVTKSAKLYINNDNYVLPTVLCDTPGVNDPFLLREAVTLNNLSETDICVVVLSAHQAFSTVDIGLLRILMALKHEQLVLFVNRIDELQDPDRQIIEIDSYIRELLEEQKLPKDLPIVFGSAAWAEVSSAGSTEMIADNATETLTNFAEARAMRLSEDTSSTKKPAKHGSSLNTYNKMADLSGLHELQRVLEEKSAVNVGRPYLDALRSEALDVSRQSLLYLEEASTSHSSLRIDLDFDAFFDDLDSTLKEADEDCLAIAKELSEEVLLMMSSAFREFIQREKASLKAHMAETGDIKGWSADSEQLRRDLNLAHDDFVARAPIRVNKIFKKAAYQIERVYGMVLEDNAQLFSVRPPVAKNPKTPVSLMRTMAIDMNTGWISNWFKGKFNQAGYIKKFETITQAEMRTTLGEMQDVYVNAFIKLIRSQLHEFLSEHITTLQNLSLLGGEGQRAEVLRELGVDIEIRQRLVELEHVVKDLETLFRRPDATEVDARKSVA